MILPSNEQRDFSLKKKTYANNYRKFGIQNKKKMTSSLNFTITTLIVKSCANVFYLMNVNI